jgi:hypothetical protein
MASSAANHERGEGIEQMQVIFRPDRGRDPAMHDVSGACAAKLEGYEIDAPVRRPYRGRTGAVLLTVHP